MAIVGAIEAELQGSSEYVTGGIGPFFKAERVEAPFGVGEFLSRALRGFRRVGDFGVANLFVDEEDLLLDQEDEIGLDEALALVEEQAFEEAAAFTVTLTSEDEALAYIFTVDGSSDHELGEPSFTVLVAAEPLESPLDDEDAASVEQEPEEALAEEDAFADPDEPGDAGADELSQVEAFLEKLRRALDSELALRDPEVRVWWEDAPDPRLQAAPIPDAPGL